jgi:hypothetical protein
MLKLLAPTATAGRYRFVAAAVDLGDAGVSLM